MLRTAMTRRPERHTYEHQLICFYRGDGACVLILDGVNQLRLWRCVIKDQVQANWEGDTVHGFEGRAVSCTRSSEGRTVPLRVLLAAPIPPPSSGIGTWAAGLIKYASQDPDVTIVHIDTAVRFRAV